MKIEQFRDLFDKRRQWSSNFIIAVIEPVPRKFKEKIKFCFNICINYELNAEGLLIFLVDRRWQAYKGANRVSSNWLSINISLLYWSIHNFLVDKIESITAAGVGVPRSALSRTLTVNVSIDPDVCVSGRPGINRSGDIDCGAKDEEEGTEVLTSSRRIEQL